MIPKETTHSVHHQLQLPSGFQEEEKTGNIAKGEVRKMLSWNLSHSNVLLYQDGRIPVL